MSTSKNPLAQVKALFFDVFGTTVDWRKSVTEALHEQNQRTLYLSDECSMPRRTREKASGMKLEDWGRFAAKWREAYYVFTRKVAKATAEGTVNEYKTIDEHHFDSLVDELKTWNLDGLWDQTTLRSMSRIWHSLEPWPDSVEGIKALNAGGYQTCTLSNGSVELLTDMAKYAHLEWTHIFSSAHFQSYKPDRKVYLGAAAKLSLHPHECCMVAAHLPDLETASKLGLRTLYVERDQEESWSPEKALAAKEWVDVWVDAKEDGFNTAAEKLEQRRT